MPLETPSLKRMYWPHLMPLGVSEPLTMAINCQCLLVKETALLAHMLYTLRGKSTAQMLCPSENGSSHMLSTWPSVLRWPSCPGSWKQLFMKPWASQLLYFQTSHLKLIWGQICALLRKESPCIYFSLSSCIDSPSSHTLPLSYFSIYFPRVKKILWCSKRLDATQIILPLGCFWHVHIITSTVFMLMHWILTLNFITAPWIKTSITS